MKKIFIILISFCLMAKSFGQIGINAANTPPDASAMLDVSSTVKGVLIPRMTTLQKFNLPNKSDGLLVYDSDLKVFSYYKFYGGPLLGFWQDFGNPPAMPPSVWNTNGNDIENNNSGSVVINPLGFTPTSKLDIHSNTATALRIIQVGPYKGMEIQSGANTNSNPVLEISNSTRGYGGYFRSSNPLGRGVYSLLEDATNSQPAIEGITFGTGNGGYFSSSLGAALVTGTGNVGIGTTTPSTKLQVEGSSIIANNTTIDPDNYVGKVIAGRIADGSGWDVQTGIAGSNGVGKTWAIGTSDDTFYVGTGDGINNNSLQSIFYSTPNKNIVLAPTTGNIGIGIGDFPAKLSVYQPTIESNSNTHVLHLRGQNPVQFFADQYNTTRGYIKGITNRSQTPQFTREGLEIGVAAGDLYLTANYSSSITISGLNNNVGIGTYPTNDYRLSVNGTTRTKELIVQTGWADYVFEENYQLRTIDELESFVKENKHLPNIPKASEIETNGLKVGETNKAMMEKIEELALYIIQLKKEIDLLKNKK